MKEVTQYEASDGRVFADKEECLKYEADGCVSLFPIPDYGHHVPLTDGDVKWMIYGDGSCYYATDAQMSRVHVRQSDHPSWATHVIYFGK